MTRPIFPLADDAVTRILLASAALMFAGLFITTPAYFLDERTINGAAVWAKPMKFWLSLGVQYASFVILAQLLTAQNRANIGLRAVVYVSVVFLLFEMYYIALQAARGRASHFNYDTNIEALLYAAMGIGALTFVLLSIVLGVMLAFQKDGDRSALKLGAVLGLIVGGVFTLAYGGFMSQYGSHFYNAPGMTDAGGLPIVGWSTSGPDMRPAHFVGTHILQIVPLVGFLSDKFAPGLARAAVWITTLALALLATALLAAAVTGNAPLGFLG